MSYRDPRVQITDQALVLQHYYLPFVAKTVRLVEIACVTERTPGWLTGRLRLWGSGRPGVWYPLDWRRPVRTTIFRVHMRYRMVDPCFSAARPEQARAAFKALGLMAS